MSFRRAVRALALALGLAAPLVLAAPASAANETNLQMTAPLVWMMVAIGFGGALITFTILVYALWKFRDPSTRGRRYG